MIKGKLIIILLTLTFKTSSILCLNLIRIYIQGQMKDILELKLLKEVIVIKIVPEPIYTFIIISSRSSIMFIIPQKEGCVYLITLRIYE